MNIKQKKEPSSNGESDSVITRIEARGKLPPTAIHAVKSKRELFSNIMSLPREVVSEIQARALAQNYVCGTSPRLDYSTGKFEYIKKL